jgi:hypothetical protein
MIEEDQSYEKQVEERIRREIKAEIKREIKEELHEKKGKSRKTAGIIISGVGAALYLIFGYFFLIVSYGSGYMFISSLSLLIAGGISLGGVILALFKVKIGGIITLISVPIALVIGIMLVLIEGDYYYYYQWLNVLQFILFPLPIPHSAHVIAGGIICLTATDIEDPIIRV